MNEDRSVASGMSDVEQQLVEIVAREAMVDVEKVNLDTRLDELNIQSADFVMILMDIEEKFGLYLSIDNEMTSLKTVGDFVQLIVAAAEKQKLDKPKEDGVS